MISLFRNMRFMLNLIPRRNTSKFAILLEYENPHGFHIPNVWKIFEVFLLGIKLSINLLFVKSDIMLVVVSCCCYVTLCGKMLQFSWFVMVYCVSGLSRPKKVSQMKWFMSYNSPKKVLYHDIFMEIIWRYSLHFWMFVRK